MLKRVQGRTYTIPTTLRLFFSTGALHCSHLRLLFSIGVLFAEHENKDGGVVPGEVGVVFAGLRFLLGGDSFVLGHEHTSGNPTAGLASAAFWPARACSSSPCICYPYRHVRFYIQ